MTANTKQAPRSEEVSGHYRAAMDTRTISRDDFTPGQETTLTIARVSREEVHDLTLSSAEVKRRERAGESTSVMKLAVHFRGTERFLVLNKTNGQALAQLFGGAVEGWVGQRVTLYRVEQVFFGQPGAVRVKAAPATPPASTPVPDPPTLASVDAPTDHATGGLTDAL